MSDKVKKFSSVWDALEDDPVKAENLKLRSALMRDIAKHIEAQGWSQVEAAKRLATTQPRVCALLNGKLADFRLDTLINMALRLGFRVNLQLDDDSRNVAYADLDKYRK
ncbi:MAG: XRE family transcriptional regulator [Pseudomonadota bacterium]